MEAYRGVKFETRFRERRPPSDPSAPDLVAWCRVFKERGFSPPGTCAVGNLSCRLQEGFLITPSNVDFDALDVADLVQVVTADAVANLVDVRGTREPSSESLLHHEVYACRPDVRAVFHGHCDDIVSHAAALGLPTTTREAEYGTRELARLAAEAARAADFFVLRRHGFVALGATPEEAGQRALAVLSTLRR